MSRCFPFPPPGYEAKPRSEHNDLLKKVHMILCLSNHLQKWPCSCPN
ncbi:Os08g0525900 [Oryza sativa Japonica Group]|uniref:Os08g0525900 protein n=1 Tax=Oryza sativa subsp. japonica TaxID=39947 RepID=A0A0P0XJ73_ORYSJ|nr:hypothetical protein EE612_045487 [Oryza sativa]KAB8109269.1 hypothetical protein EE612_045487 [Oryza sativa]BAT06340.1 Os08g0525900 [Oryza sativa Japonica Group]